MHDIHMHDDIIVVFRAWNRKHTTPYSFQLDFWMPVFRKLDIAGWITARDSQAIVHSKTLLVWSLTALVRAVTATVVLWFYTIWRTISTHAWIKIVASNCIPSESSSAENCASSFLLRSECGQAKGSREAQVSVKKMRNTSLRSVRNTAICSVTLGYQRP